MNPVAASAQLTMPLSETRKSMDLYTRGETQLTPEEKAEMQRLNPKGPEDRKEEEEEENFLRGKDKNDQSRPHHHH